MKKSPERVRIITVLWVLAAMMAVGSCDDDPTNDDLTTVEVVNATSAFAILVADARTGEPLSGVPVTLRISGPAAPRVIDVVGTSATQLTTESGFVALGLTGAVPTNAAPAELLVLASAAGYLETSQPLRLAAERSGPAIIRMVAPTSPPPGTAAGSSGAAHAGPGGVLAATVTVSTAADAVTGGRATVRLPAGSVVRDPSGTPLSGALQTTIVYFNNRSEESLTAFPGGFGAQVANPPAGLPAEGVFTSAGFTAITVRDGSGREARTFSAPIQVTLDVPVGTVNPETGVAVKNGDVVPYWSYQPATGEWRYEGPATVAGPNPAGNFTATLALGHLTYLNLDWMGARCGTFPQVEISGNPGRRTLLYLITAVGGGSGHAEYSADTVLTILHAPARNDLIPVRIEARDPNTGRTVGTFQTRQLCPGPHRMTVNLALEAPVVTVALRLRCGDVELLPWGWIVYRRVGTREWLWGAHLRAGEGVIRGLQPNTRYEVTAAGIYAGATFSGTSTVTTGADGSDTRITVEFGVDGSICAKLGAHDQGGGVP